MTAIKKFEYVEDDIKIDVLFNDNTYINSTEAYKAFGKDKHDFRYHVKNTLKPYAKRLIALGKIPKPNNSISDEDLLNEVILVQKGGNDPSLRGTWLHPKLAIEFARWLSMDFGIWCNEKTEELLDKGTVSISNDAVQVNKPKALNAIATTQTKVKKFSKNTRLHILQDLVDFVLEIVNNNMDFGASLAELSKHTNKQSRAALYDRMKAALKRCVDNKKISSGQYIHMDDLLEVFRLRLAHIRTTTAEKKAEKLEDENETLSEHYKEMETKLEVVHNKLKAATKPRLKLNIRKGFARQDIGQIDAIIKKTDDYTSLYAGTVFPSKPEHKPDLHGTLGIYSAVIFLNKDRDWNPAVQIYQETGSSNLLATITLKEVDHLLIGEKTIGVTTYFAILDEEEGALLIYKGEGNVQA